MKRILFIAGFLVILTCLSNAQQTETGAVITFNKDVHDFGKVPTTNAPDGKVEFRVYNKGKKPLVLSSVRACCGTQVKEYTVQPISPGDSGIVKVEFRILPRPHRISRTVTIQSNAENRQTAVLRIVGEVIEPPDNSIEL
jgi:hypothetical protein